MKTLKSFGLTLVMALAFPMLANAYDSQYRIVAKLVNGQEEPLSGMITLSGSQSYAGNIDYKKLTIFINDMINYEWSIIKKYILDETSVQLYDYSGNDMVFSQINDSVYKFTLPLFYGSQRGNVVYKTVIVRDDCAGSDGGNSNGASWSVSGRGLRGSMPKPMYGSNAEGTVVVAIRVDQNGNVVSATKGAGTNTADQTLINAAIEAAKRAKFTAGDSVVTGSITYVFRLN